MPIQYVATVNVWIVQSTPRSIAKGRYRARQYTRHRFHWPYHMVTHMSTFDKLPSINFANNGTLVWELATMEPWRKNGKETANGKPTVPLEYVKSSILSHLETPQGTKYIVRWFENGPADDTLEPSYYIPWLLIRPVLESSNKQEPTGKALLSREVTSSLERSYTNRNKTIRKRVFHKIELLSKY